MELRPFIFRFLEKFNEYKEKHVKDVDGKTSWPVPHCVRRFANNLYSDQNPASNTVSSFTFSILA